jgi:hypothetical protein
MRIKVLLLALKYFFRVIAVCLAFIVFLIGAGYLGKLVTGDPMDGITSSFMLIGLCSLIFICYDEAKKKIDLENSSVYKILKDSK